jgi:histidinol phosphatase-like PHP family hydrolase
LGGLHQLGLDISRAADCQLMRMFRIAKAEGCKFFFGSDAHAPSHMENLRHTDVLADILELTMDDIMTIARG